MENIKQTSTTKENSTTDTQNCILSSQSSWDSHRSTTLHSPTRHYGRRMKLNCRHGYNLAILPDGTVSSSDDSSNKFCILEFTSMFPGHVRIKGVEANLYLAMNKQSKLYGEPNPTKNSTIFIEQPEGPYSAYLSLKYQRKKWYVAIKKNGKIKLGTLTRRGQNATHFLPVTV